MVYLVASIASLVLLAGGLGLIAFTITGSHARIIGALLGQPMDQRVVIFSDARPRHRVTVATRRPAVQLRAVA